MAVELAKSHGDQPETLLAAVGKLVADARKEYASADDYSSELLELIPYMKGLTEQQTGTEFLGLDSGFPHINRICNGLDTGLESWRLRPVLARRR